MIGKREDGIGKKMTGGDGEEAQEECRKKWQTAGQRQKKVSLPYSNVYQSLFQGFVHPQNFFSYLLQW